MAFDYNDARETALEIISEFGKAGVVTKKGTTGGTDAFGNVTPDVPDINISGIITPLLQYKSAEIDGESIKRGDSYVLFHSDVAPEIGYQTNVNGVVMRVVDTYTLDSVDDINVFRKLQLRR